MLARSSLVAALAALSLPLATVAAQGEKKPRKPPKIVLEVGEHDIFELIDRVARHLGRNYLTAGVPAQAVPTAKFSLQTPVVLTESNCEDTLTRLAYTCGLAMVPVSPELGIFEWVFMAGPKRGEVMARATEMTPEKVLARRNSRIRVLTALNLEHIDANRITNTLRPFFMSSNNPAPLMFGMGSNSALLISGFADEVANAIDLVRRFDVPPNAGATAPAAPTFVEPERVGGIDDPNKHVATLVPLAHLEPAEAAQGLSGSTSRSGPAAQAQGYAVHDPFELRVSAIGSAISLTGRAGDVAVAIQQLRAADVAGASSRFGPSTKVRMQMLESRLRQLEKQLEQQKK